jgi:hypothetical protein
MNFASFAAAAAALAIIPAAAQAQDAAAPAPAETTAAAPAATAVNVTQGASVTGNDGMPIGTVTQVLQDAAVVDTGTHQIPLPTSAFAQGDSGLTLNITKAELDASYAEQMAAANAALNEKLVVGVPVMTADSQTLGTVDMIEGENVVLAMEGDQKLTLGKDVFAVDSAGGVIVRATMDQIQQALGGASAAPAPEQG